MNKIIKVASAAALMSAVLTAPSANASLPYGGCVEAHTYSTSPGAQDCREAGWTISPHAVFGPRGYLRWSDLKPCKSDETAENFCVWDAGRRGNRMGTGFWVFKDVAHMAQRSVGY